MLSAAAVRFFDQVAEIAEQEGHHPDLHLINYREVQVWDIHAYVDNCKRFRQCSIFMIVQVVLSTHAIGGVSTFDAILAAKIDALPVEYSPKWLRQQS